LNIVCDKTLLSAAIDGVSKAVTMRSSIPVLEGILLKAEGFQLTLTGYDLEMGIVTTIEANIKEPGEIVLNTRTLCASPVDGEPNATGLNPAACATQLASSSTTSVANALPNLVWGAPVASSTASCWMYVVPNLVAGAGPRCCQY
jgi:hypothetical protein